MQQERKTKIKKIEQVIYIMRMVKNMLIHSDNPLQRELIPDSQMPKVEITILDGQINILITQPDYKHLQIG